MLPSKGIPFSVRLAPALKKMLPKNNKACASSNATNKDVKLMTLMGL
jgi:hypothetical protein